MVWCWYLKIEYGAAAVAPPRSPSVERATRAGTEDSCSRGVASAAAPRHSESRFASSPTTQHGEAKLAHENWRNSPFKRDK